MLDLQNAEYIYIDGKKVEAMYLNGKKLFVKNENPLILMAAPDNFHIWLGNKKTIETTHTVFQADANPSPNTPNYQGYITLTAPDGETYYINKISQSDGYSLKKYDDSYLSNGWCTYLKTDGKTEYSIWYGHYTRNFTNEWYFSYTLQPKPNTYPIDDRLIDNAIEIINKSFPIVNIQKGTSSKNFLYLEDYEDTWLGLCTSWTDHIEIKLNYKTLTSYYGTYVYGPKNKIYRQWLHTTVHEIGHTLGFPDQPLHKPSLYDYNGDRVNEIYLQANDIYYLKAAYNKYFNVDSSIFDREPNSFIDAKETPMAEKMMSRVAQVPILEADDNYFCNNFDYMNFDTLSDLIDMADNIVTATLTYNRNEKLDIGGNFELEYDIYTINPIKQEKGTLKKFEMKVHPQENKIEENKTYRLYLQEYERTPYSPLNIQSAIEEIKEEEN